MSITLVIDQNPAPMAAKFQLGPDAKVSEISTRVRVNSYTDVHAVAELSDGKLYMIKTYVKASGGCSAPAAKNADEAKGRLGQMRFRQFAKAGEGPASGAREAQIMIGHPNNSGLQMDQVTQLYVPAFFVNELRVWQDDSLVLVDGRRHFDFGRSQHSVHLRPERREAFPCRGKGHRGPRLPDEWKVDRFRDLMRSAAWQRPRPQKHRTSASAWARRSSLSALRLFGRAELPAKISPDLRHAQHGFRRDIAFIGHQRRDNVDRTGALLDRLPRLAVRLQAAENVFGTRRRRIIVDVLGARDHDHRHSAINAATIQSYRSDKRYRLPPAANRGSYAMTVPLKRYIRGNGSRTS